MKLLRRLIPKRYVRIELLLLVTFVLGVYLAAGNVLAAAEYPSKHAWVPWSAWFTALLTSAVWVPCYALYQTIQTRRQSRENRATVAARDLALACQQIVGAIAHACEAISVNDLAACIWVCRDDDTFDEVARFYMPQDRPPTGMRWHKGKGVAGVAWASGYDLFADLRPLIAKLTTVGHAQFDAMPTDERFGLSAAELTQTQRYTGIGAVHLHSTRPRSSKLLGMLILDYVGERGFDCIAEQAQRWPVTKYTGACAEILTEAGARL